MTASRHIRIEGGSKSCAYCNRTLTFNFMARPGPIGCTCDRYREAIAKEKAAEEKELTEPEPEPEPEPELFKVSDGWGATLTVANGVLYLRNGSQAAGFTLSALGAAKALALAELIAPRPMAEVADERSAWTALQTKITEWADR